MIDRPSRPVLPSRRAVAAAVLAAAWAVAAYLLAAQASNRFTVPDAAEAWYAGVPPAGCMSPIGCPPIAPATLQNYRISVVGSQ